jgi:hypothetical protein
VPEVEVEVQEAGEVVQEAGEEAGGVVPEAGEVAGAIRVAAEGAVELKVVAWEA